LDAILQTAVYFKRLTNYEETKKFYKEQIGSYYRDLHSKNIIPRSGKRMGKRKIFSMLLVVVLIVAMFTNAFLFGPLIIFSNADPGDISENWHNETTSRQY